MERRDSTSWDDWEEPLDERGPGSVVPWLLFVPALIAIGVGFWFARGRGQSPRMAVELEVAPTPDVRGFGGALEAPDGGVFRARLVPLHARPERQSFEAESLARRLGLESGEPWRLELRWEAGPGSNEGSLDPSQLVVSGEGEARLAPFDAPGERGDRPYDPVAVLFARPESGLAPGHSVQLLLWGSAPRERGRLSLWGRELLLEPLEFDASALPRALARRGGEQP